MNMATFGGQSLYHCQPRVVCARVRGHFFLYNDENAVATLSDVTCLSVIVVLLLLLL